jgi:Gpi18-like mannosyltransferase
VQFHSGFGVDRFVNMGMDSSRRYAILVFVTAVATRVGFHLWTGFTADDAFITFRYAENLAAGLGFVYNEGQQVLGSSTPLFTLLLSALIAAKITALHGALLISWIAVGLTAVIVYRMARSLRLGRLSYLPTLIYILWPRSIIADNSGMETALFTLLVTAALFYLRQRQIYYALAAATMASATRIEGMFLLAILMIIIFVI